MIYSSVLFRIFGNLQHLYNGHVNVPYTDNLISFIYKGVVFIILSNLKYQLFYLRRNGKKVLFQLEHKFDYYFNTNMTDVIIQKRGHVKCDSCKHLRLCNKNDWEPYQFTVLQLFPWQWSQIMLNYRLLTGSLISCSFFWFSLLGPVGRWLRAHFPLEVSVYILGLCLMIKWLFIKTFRVGGVAQW